MLRAGLSNAEVARALNVSDRRVSEVKARMGSGSNQQDEAGADQGDIKAERDKYEKGLRKAIPVRTRVKILQGLVQSKNPQVAIKALEMADRLSGYAKEDAALAQQTAPIFALPEGTKVRFSK
jgi:hypothetical protein